MQPIFEQVVPLGMDGATIEKFWHLKQDVERIQSLQEIKILADEYRRICSEGIQIDQEQLPIAEITAPITALFQAEM